MACPIDVCMRTSRLVQMAGGKSLRFLIVAALLAVGIAVSSGNEKETPPAAAKEHPTPAAAAPAAASHAAAHSGTDLKPDAIFTLLREGNERFIAGTMKHPNLTADRRTLTATAGQAPIATILSCSDSRVPLEFIFDRGLGDLFVVRVAGNVADTIEIGTIEYGVDHLGTPVLIVLGHTKCGAVTAAVKGGELHGLIPALVDDIKPAALKAKSAGGTEATQITAAIRANVFQSIADILKRSKSVREMFNSGKLEIIGGVYDIEHGHIEWLGAHDGAAH